MANGQKFTVPAAAYLREYYRNSTYHVFYDHGSYPSQRIYSWFGTSYTTPYAAKHLSWIDIIVADPKSGKVDKIFEIEDSAAKPKTLVADLMAVLLGDGLAFASRSDWQVGEWTSLIVLAYVSTSAAQAKYQARLEHVQRHTTSFLTCLKTRNAAIGRIVLKTFKDLGELESKLEN